MRYIAKEMIPRGEPFSKMALLNAASDGFKDDDIIHHDDDPGQATDDEDYCNHYEDQRQSLLTLATKLVKLECSNE